ncbi:TRAP transporter permease [Pseudohalocynthiibacter aestuariivivens]|jgi:TRAP transporter 4TM/12TM fusion protein|uniref:TRAP transporter permease n=1 Tax=Pseudohalocynthiibacter aestuariivivens TaxID=1591409 RepID=A0ABV5JCK5_9RHOB|nr:MULTISPECIES: TRAP transporter permease [Pseudohalocynthiibacter]MBS9717312.1 TRAP transporter permease [Pseudohalocynthiibacter aestuariivivens]MCK0104218.1 TRAP transporter permease [Pseudohalocynthiibacter sp. F2068]
MTDSATRTAEDMVAEADTGARNAGPFVTKLIFSLCIIWSLFQLYIASKLPGVLAQATGISMMANIVAQARYVHLAFALVLATLAFPIFGHRNKVPWYDWVLVALGSAACLYLVVFRFQIADRPGLWSTSDIVMSGIGMAALMVAVFRSLGLPLVIIGSLFLALAFFGGYSEWIGSITNYGGSSFSKAMGHYWMQTEGVFGVALGVSTSMIFLFVLFGAFLEKAGGGNWFIKVAISLLGALRGGPAKAAVLSSMMTGMISGSSIANTVTTGTFTIPLMKRIGFSPEKAGAVEVASSTNGQLTPPVMGAAAFLMVEYVNIPYIEVVKHAFLPAIISYIALLYIVHLESLKMGLEGLKKPGRQIGVLMILILFITGFLGMAAITFLVVGFRAMLEPMMPGATVYPALALLALAYLGLLYVASKFPDIEVDDPNAKAVSAPRLTPTFLGGAYFALPIFVLVWNLMVRTEYLDRLSPALSAFWATVTMIIVALTHRPIKAVFRGESDLVNQFMEGFREFVAGLEGGARNMIGIGVATGAAGIIVGTISLTGAHQIIGQVIEVISGGNLIILLVLVAVLSLILGMGLPTTANYIVVSSLMAPVIVSVGAQSGLIVPLIAVHMFVFYFGILADDTPPVGLAAYAAAAISRGDPIKTGLVGFSYDIRTALLPFMFIFNTDLLLINVGPAKAVMVFFVSLVAMLVFAAVTQGYFIAKSRKWEGAVMLLVVFMLFRPDFFLDQWQDKYTEKTGSEALTALEALPVGSSARLRISAPDFDTSVVGSTTVSFTPDAEGTGAERLEAVGLSVVEDNGILTLDEPFPGTPYYDILANDYDFYGEEPAQIEAVAIENDRMAKEIFFIPALLLLLMIVTIQRPRATQPAF